MTTGIKMFPVLWQGDRNHMQELRDLDCPKRIPWSVVEPHAEQALRNHSQTLQRLAERGGLSPQELAAVLTNRHWKHVMEMSNTDAVQFLHKRLTEVGFPPVGRESSLSERVVARALQAASDLTEEELQTLILELKAKLKTRMKQPPCGYCGATQEGDYSTCCGAL